jgi:hypothetical protein
LIPKSIGFALLVAIVFYLLVLVSKSFLLQKFDHQGVLGFESGTWEVRVNKWMRRIIFTDYYSVAFLAFGIAGVWLYLKKKWNLLMFVLALSGLALTTFHFNFPQKIEHFEKYRAALAVRPWSLEGKWWTWDNLSIWGWRFWFWWGDSYLIKCSQPYWNDSGKWR